MLSGFGVYVTSDIKKPTTADLKNEKEKESRQKRTNDQIRSDQQQQQPTALELLQLIVGQTDSAAPI